MKRVKTVGFGVFVAMILTLGGCQTEPGDADAQADVQTPPQSGSEEGDIPIFQFDPTWPKMPLPNRWLVGNVAGVYVDGVKVAESRLRSRLQPLFTHANFLSQIHLLG